MNNNELVNHFLKNNRSLPELEDVYHHVYLKDLNNEYVAVNYQFANFLNVSPQQLEGRGILDSLDEEVIQSILAIDQQVFEGEATKIFNELAIVDSKKVCFLSIKAPIWEKSTIIGLCGISFLVHNQTFERLYCALNIAAQLLQRRWQPEELNFFLYKPRLTPRETECLQLYMRGNSVLKIAQLLQLSCRTVESYLENIKSKLGVTKRNELLPLAFKLYSELTW